MQINKFAVTIILLLMLALNLSLVAFLIQYISNIFVRLKLPLFIVKKIKHLSLVLSFICILNEAFAQAPIITSFNPASGIASTTVTISGSNFDATPAGNTVYFGAAKAVVLSASTNQLVVRVPQGTTHQPITITANGLTGYSSTPFYLTFTAPPFSPTYFKTRTDVTSGNFVYGIAVKDLDGDGRSDMVVVNSGSNTVSFIKNTTAGGVLAFVAPITSPINNYSVGVAIEDLNGDGKPDVVITNFNANTISLFKNTSSGGTLSFAPAITVSTGKNPYNVVIADFDGDGRPDIAVTNENSIPAYVSVFPNTSLPGGALVFSSEKKFPAGSMGRGLYAADLDADGKPDLVVASQDGAVSVFKNTSTANTINFAQRLIYNIPGSVPESVVAVDLDGDNKPDIAVANNDVAGRVSVFKNLSTVGSVSFGTAQVFAVSSNPFSIAVGDINGDGKPDIAVADQLSNTVSVLINTSVPSTGIISLANKVDFATGDYPRSLVIADMDGNGRPDLVVGNNNTSIVSILLADDTKGTSVITFPPIAQQILGQSPPFSPGASSTNSEVPIVYTSSDPFIAYIDANGLIHIVSPGSVVITATQAGNNDFIPAVPVSQTLTTLDLQTISFSSIGLKTTCDADFNIGAKSSNITIPLSYSTLYPAVATVDASGNIHITGPGTTVIKVMQPGNALYQAAAPVTQTLTVTAPAKPNVTLTANALSACEGSSLTISAVVNAFSSTTFNYQWSINGVNTGANSPSLIVNNANKTDVFMCIATDKLSCLPPDISNSLTGISILPYSAPAVVISSPVKDPVCSGSAISFTATVTNGGGNPTYHWKVNGIAAGNNSQLFESNTLLNNDQITCEVVLSNGTCLIVNNATSNAIVVTIKPTPQPRALISITSSSLYEGSVISFAVEVTNAGKVLNYQWKVNGVNAGYNISVLSSNQLYNNDIITCIVTGSQPCSLPVISNIIKLSLLPPLAITIPNSFTPNSDGVNDLWTIPGLASYPQCKVNVYNRYGKQIYYSIGYSKPWDGNSQGNAVPSGVYYYVINLNNTFNPLSGSVTVIR